MTFAEVKKEAGSVSDTKRGKKKRNQLNRVGSSKQGVVRPRPLP